MAKVMWMDWWTPVHVGDADDTTGLYESRIDLPDEELENVADMLTGNLRFLKRYGDEVSVTVDGIDLWADEQSVAHVAIEALCMDEPGHTFTNWKGKNGEVVVNNRDDFMKIVKAYRDHGRAAYVEAQAKGQELAGAKGNRNKVKEYINSIQAELKQFSQYVD